MKLTKNISASEEVGDGSFRYCDMKKIQHIMNMKTTLKNKDYCESEKFPVLLSMHWEPVPRTDIIQTGFLET